MCWCLYERIDKRTLLSPPLLYIRRSHSQYLILFLWIQYPNCLSRTVLKVYYSGQYLIHHDAGQYMIPRFRNTRFPKTVKRHCSLGYTRFPRVMLVKTWFTNPVHMIPGRQIQRSGGALRLVWPLNGMILDLVIHVFTCSRSWSLDWFRPWRLD